QAAYFELKSDKQVPIADGEDKDDEIVWIEEKDFNPKKLVNSELPIWLARLKDPTLGWPEPLLNWPESVKEAQRNWIGKSEGAEIYFELRFHKNPADNDNRGPNGEKAALPVYTTRADTLFGVTYIVLAPEHPWVTLATDANHDVLN